MKNGNEAHFKVDHVTVVRFMVRRMLDAACVDARITEITASPPMDGPDTVLDFSRVEFISSAVLNKLIVLDRAIESLGGKLVVCGLSPSIRDLLSMTRLDQMFRVATDQETALQQFKLKA